MSGPLITQAFALSTHLGRTNTTAKSGKKEPPVPRLAPNRTSIASYCAATIRPDDRFMIGKPTFGKTLANDHFWPKVALRRHRKSDRLCDSHEGLESTPNSHSSALTRTSIIAFQSGHCPRGDHCAPR
jgi:hypothetical protein